ncbi:MAG: hypothetical protein KAW94_03570 [Candidatus Thorarchaeota archaeon]|jgi:hypothetical protein|nr:hypothetical protein [Candidatus Thorarchaeota archaeon]
MAKSSESAPERTRSKLTGLDTAAKYGAILGGTSGLGNLMVSLTGQTGLLGDSLIWFQGFSFGSLAFALLMMILHYEINRDKWPTRLKELTRRTMLSSSLGPDYLTGVGIRAHIRVLRLYHRMALSEGRHALADDFRAEIDTWDSRLESNQ